MEAWKMIEETLTHWLDYNLQLDKAKEQGADEYKRVYEEVKGKLLGEINYRDTVALILSNVLTMEDISEFSGYTIDELIEIKSKLLLRS